MSRSISSEYPTRNVSEVDELRRQIASVPYFATSSESTRAEGFDEFFEPPLEPKYECPICLLGLRDPVQTQCGHRFCKNCIIRSIRESGSKCPVDNTPLSERELYPDNFAKREMMSFNVLCRLKKERGCPWVGPLKDLETHLRLCPFSETSCPNECGAVMQRREIDMHIQGNCPKRKVQCQHCGNTVVVSSMENHLQHCPNIVLECTNCQQSVTRGQMKDHLQYICPSVKSKCPFAFLNCKFEDYNPAVANHVAENHIKHLMELAKFVQQSSSQTSAFSKPGTFSANQPRSLTPPSGPQEHSPQDSELLQEASSRSATIQREVDLIGSRGNEQRQFLAELDRKVEDMRVRYDRHIADLTHKLMKLETREIELEGRVCAGTFIWKIDNFRRCREESITGLMAAMHSPPFYTSLYGYKMCLRMNLNGVDTGIGRHISLFVHMMQGDWDDILEWPFTGRITLAILDQSENVEFRRPISETLVAKPNLLAFQKPTAPRNHKGYGYVEFCQIDQLREEQYIKNNSILVRIQIFH